MSRWTSAWRFALYLSFLKAQILHLHLPRPLFSIMDSRTAFRSKITRVKTIRSMLLSPTLTQAKPLSNKHQEPQLENPIDLFSKQFTDYLSKLSGCPRGRHLAPMVPGVVDRECVSGLELSVAEDAGMRHVDVKLSVPQRLGLAGRLLAACLATVVPVIPPLYHRFQSCIQL
jgi:hypothetical protein